MESKNNSISIQENAVVVLEVACDLKSGWQQQAAMYAMAAKVAEAMDSAGFGAAIDPVLGHKSFYIRLELADDSRFGKSNRKKAEDYITAAGELLKKAAS